MSGLKYHGGMKGLYAMLALTEASLVDDDVDTTTIVDLLNFAHLPEKWNTSKITASSAVDERGISG